MRHKEILHELSIPDDQTGATLILRREGYKVIGSGSFGTVFKKENAGYVLKLFDSSDHSFIRFVKLAMQHQGNPHFPKYKGKLLKVTDKYYAIRMEELNEITVYDDYCIEIIRKVADYTRSCVRDISSVEVRNPSLYEFMCLPKNKSLKEAAELIAGITNNEGEIDISRINVMLRGGVLVIIDPLYSYN